MNSHRILTTLVKGPQTVNAFLSLDRSLIRAVFADIRRWLDPKIVAEWEDVFAEMDEPLPPSRVHPAGEWFDAATMSPPGES